jgi:predicted ATPase
MRAAAQEDSSSFSDFLKFLRKRARLTQRELGIAAGYSETQITRLEGGSRLPDPVVVKTRFVDALALRDEPRLAQQLIALAEAAHGQTAITAPATASRTNLPAHLSRFIGRERELEEIIGLVSANRLVTLTGAGGAGKTRLATEVSAHMLDYFADGVWLIELSAISDAALLAGTFATALGLRPTSRPAQVVLTDYLRGRNALLIVDNCEHLINACGGLVEALGRACPRLHLLCTSREPLRLSGESTWRVPPLPTHEAVLLFEQRASATQFGFALTDANTPVVTHICERLDGMPLAIELAAARLEALPLQQIASRLDDRFRLLTNGARTALPRQQTLRTMIEWSYNLLTDAERALLRHLSAFAGGWRLEFAEALFDDPETLQLHAQLVGKSLVVMEESVESDTGERYRLLETIRQYAHEKLDEAGEVTQVRRRHLEVFTNWAQAAKPHLHRTEQVQWLDQLEAEVDNFRAALTWVAQSGDVRCGETLIDGLWWFWMQRGYLSEGIKWISDVLLSGSAVSDATWVSAHTRMGWLALHKGDIFDGRRWFDAAVERVHTLGDPRQVLQVYWGLGLLAADFTEAERLLNEAIDIAHRAGWAWEESQVRWALGSRMRKHGDPQLAHDVLMQGLALARQAGDRLFVSQLLLKLGLRAMDRGDYAAARPLLEVSVAQVQALGDPVGVGDAIIELSTLGVRQGEWASARTALRESIASYSQVGNAERLAQCISIAAAIALGQGQADCAARLLGAVAAARAESPRRFEFNSTLYEEYDRVLPLVRARLDSDAFEAAWAEGQGMSLAEALQEAIAV